MGFMTIATMSIASRFAALWTSDTRAVRYPATFVMWPVAYSWRVPACWSCCTLHSASRKAPIRRTRAVATTLFEQERGLAAREHCHEEAERKEDPAYPYCQRAGDLDVAQQLHLLRVLRDREDDPYDEDQERRLGKATTDARDGDCSKAQPVATDDLFEITLHIVRSTERVW